MADGAETAAMCERSLGIIAPSFVFLALGLGLYFASQGLNTLIYPVSGAALRLAIVAVVFYLSTDETSPELLLWSVAAAVACYGGLTAIALAYGPWSK